MFRGCWFGDYLTPPGEAVWQWLQAQALGPGCTVWLLLTGISLGLNFFIWIMGIITVPTSQGQRVVMRNEWDDPCQEFGTTVTSSINAVPTTLVLRVFHMKSLTTKNCWKLKWNNIRCLTYQMESYGLSPARAEEKLKDNFWFIWLKANIGSPGWCGSVN